MFLTPEQTGGPKIFSLRDSNRYVAIWACEFDIKQLAETLGQAAGKTWQEHRSLILLACAGGKLFEWIEGCTDGDV